MQGMIFAAGLGTRLYPITKTIPKALVKVGNYTLLEHNIRKMISSGIEQITINVHHFAREIINFLQTKDFACKILISDEKQELLDTGGGLMKAWEEGLLNTKEEILIHNVDILSDTNFAEVYDYHHTQNHAVTLCVKKRQTKRYLLFDENDNLCGKENTDNGQKIITRNYKEIHRYAFSGIQIISPKILDKITCKGNFSIIDAYLDLSANYDINLFCDKKSKWLDVGKLEALSKAETLFG